jgi:hypothetical protein
MRSARRPRTNRSRPNHPALDTLCATDGDSSGVSTIRPILLPPSRLPGRRPGAKEAGSETLLHQKPNTVRQSTERRQISRGPARRSMLESRCAATAQGYRFEHRPLWGSRRASPISSGRPRRPGICEPGPGFCDRVRGTERNPDNVHTSWDQLMFDVGSTVVPPFEDAGSQSNDCANDTTDDYCWQPHFDQGEPGS